MTASKTDARTDNTPLLTVADLRVRLDGCRGPVYALDGVSLSVSPGGTLGLVGESGSGKSILCRAILGLLPRGARINDNSIFYEGKSLSNTSRSHWRHIRGSKIAMIFQNPMSVLNPVLRVGKQIEESLRVHQQLSRVAGRIEAVELLRSVGIPDPEIRARYYPHQFSGGMCQRIAIAMALAVRPNLLLADEPTTALDVTVQAEILYLLEKLRLSIGMAMLLVSHDLAVVANQCHEIAVMYAGRIVEQAPSQKLFAKARHPYTRTLINSHACIEGVEIEEKWRLDRGLQGPPPATNISVPGCGFAPSCPRCLPRCLCERPRMRELSKGSSHRFACFSPLSDEPEKSFK